MPDSHTAHTAGRVDAALDKILKAAGSGRLSNYMPSTQDKLREAMREVLEDAAIAKAGGKRPDEYRIERRPTYGYTADLSNLLSYRPRRD